MCYIHLNPLQSRIVFKSIMKDSDIDMLRDKHIAVFYNELSDLYRKAKGSATDFDDRPEEVQKGLFDLIFKIGKTQLGKKFTKFNDAVKKENHLLTIPGTKRFFDYWVCLLKTSFPSLYMIFNCITIYLIFG